MPPMVPQQPRRQGTVRAPLLGQRPQRLGAGPRRQPLKIRRRRRERQIPRRKHVLAAQREQQIHLRRPRPQSAHRDDGRHRRVVLQRGEARLVEPPIGERGGERLGMCHFRPRQPGLAQCPLRLRQHPFRCQRPRHRPQPPPDRRRRLVADLLADDGLQKPREARRAHAPGQRTGGRLDAGQVGIGGAQRVEAGAGGGRGVREGHAALVRRAQARCNAVSANGRNWIKVSDMETVATSASAAATTNGTATLPHILVIDDDREIRDLLARFLEKQRFRVTAVRDAREARRAVPNGVFNLVVLDLMLPGESGLDFARWLRTQSDVPIVMLTALGEETDRIIGLELGADDYLAKPFNPRELLARIRAVLRRVGEAATRQEAPPRALRFAGWTLEPPRRRLVDGDGVEVPLTGGEYDLLLALAERPNRVLTRDMLLDLLRGRQAGPFDRAIDVAVSRLRRKLEDDGRNAQLIKTVRGGGYVLAATVERV